jgi:hypothetical protein
MNCKTCNHWKLYEPTCKWGECLKAKGDDQGELVDSSSLAMAYGLTDGGDCADCSAYGELLTKPEFGCVMWEPAPTENN